MTFRIWDFEFTAIVRGSEIRNLKSEMRVPSPGIEPGLRPSQSRVHPPHSKDISIERPTEESDLVLQLRRLPCFRHTRRANRANIPTWTRTRTWTFGGSNAIRYTIGIDSRADDWIRTSMIRFTRPAPFSVEPRRQKHRCKESNPVGRFWRPPALPGAHR